MTDELRDTIRRYYERVIARLQRRIEAETDIVGQYRLRRAARNRKKSLRELLTQGDQQVTIKPSATSNDGGPGSGNHGHKGVPGQIGGSAGKGEVGRCNYSRENNTITLTADLKVKFGEKVFKVSAGSVITGVEDFAGKGCKKPVEVENYLIEKYGGQEGEWTHSLGFSEITQKGGKTKSVELHWFECEGIGQTGMKVKKFVGKSKNSESSKLVNEKSEQAKPEDELREGDG